MRWRELLSEAWRSARSALVATVMVAIVVSAMCATTGLTVGRAIAAQSQIEARLEEAGSRSLTVTDARGGGFLTSSIIDQINAFSIVERAVGVTAAFDSVNTAIGLGGTGVPTWFVVGDMADAITLTWGRWPEPGEALASAEAVQALGLEVPVGSVVQATHHPGPGIPIVGSFTAREPLTHLNAGVVGRAPQGTVAHRVDVLADSSSNAVLLTSATVHLLNRADPQDLSIDAPTSLAQIETEVLGDLADFNQGLVVLVLVAGAVLVSVVTFADTLVRRSELGRRRALGAQRWAVVSLLVIRSAIGGLVGVALGTVIASAVNVMAGVHPDPAFTVATGVMALAVTVVASCIPATVAAHQDPVQVLRTP
ncbi:MAG: hypothetical protein LBH13_09505 [Cellulomonadaceae bacterium]|jgi:putative ABC transport system permease protein|nr:hypothetical protein [Cellulomonadaceae bacterium]